jgi:hypothetical protein
MRRQFRCLLAGLITLSLVAAPNQPNIRELLSQVEREGFSRAPGR